MGEKPPLKSRTYSGLVLRSSAAPCQSKSAPASFRLASRNPCYFTATTVWVSAFVGGVQNSVSFADTNMRRVLHCLFFGVDVPEPTASEKELQSLAATLVPQGRG